MLLTIATIEVHIKEYAMNLMLTLMLTGDKSRMIIRVLAEYTNYWTGGGYHPFDLGVEYDKKKIFFYSCNRQWYYPHWLHCTRFSGYQCMDHIYKQINITVVKRYYTYLSSIVSINNTSTNICTVFPWHTWSWCYSSIMIFRYCNCNISFYNCFSSGGNCCFFWCI